MPSILYGTHYGTGKMTTTGSDLGKITMSPPAEGNPFEFGPTRVLFWGS
jgi:hypothetical protein